MFLALFRSRCQVLRKKSEIVLFFETPDLLRFDAVRSAFFSQHRDRSFVRECCSGDQFINQPIVIA